MTEKSDDDTLIRRRSAASIVLLDTDRIADETAAFDVLVDLDYAGHWVETKSGRAAVTWIGGELIETQLCQGEAKRVIAAIRPLIPASRLKPDKFAPEYEVAVLEALILAVVAELHPEHLSTEDLLQKVAGNPEDEREIETGLQAIRRLREVGLLTPRADELVEPTPAALRACALLA